MPKTQTTVRKPRFKKIDRIPFWALIALEYGPDEDSSLDSTDRAQIADFEREMARAGLFYRCAVTDNDGFTACPRFGLACETYTAQFEIIRK